MKKIILLSLAILLSAVVIGQQSSGCKKTCCSKGKPTLATLDNDMQVVLVINKENYKVDNIKDYEIESEWVESISILKDQKSKELWANEKGAALIYIKEDYNKKILKQIKKLE